MDVPLVHSSFETGLESCVGNTPLIPLRKTNARLSPQVHVLAKAEWLNPAGSVKDRPALHILRRAIRDGPLGGERRLLDSTSGNMGISYATLGAALGVSVTLAVPGSATPERMTALRALGAEVIVTDPLEGSDGAIRAARELAAAYPERFYYANQYDNPANWEAHYLTTGPEIVRQTRGRLTHFVAGLGTTGTFTGVGRYLRECLPGVRLVAVQPDAPLHGLEGLKHLESCLVPGIYDASLADDVVSVATEEAYEMARRLAREEGLFVGVSSGAAAVAALRVAAALDQGVVVTVFPDAGYKYLSQKSVWEGAR
ncbi:MAG TPA: cysteine synthase family protein [Gemmatimonadaceae bacterium]|nr:cysteine synthase family protein [Gemmatimonadaceae bacterium]